MLVIALISVGTETLLSSEGRKLRNCLFCLKRMFQVCLGVQLSVWHLYHPPHTLHTPSTFTPHTTPTNVPHLGCALCLLLQDDEELVYEFVGSEGLSCLLKVGQDSEPTFQPYILKGERAQMDRRTYSHTYLRTVDLLLD